MDKSNTQVAYIKNRADGTTSIPTGLVKTLDMPLDSNQTFQITWVTTNTSAEDLDLYYKGFITD